MAKYISTVLIFEMFILIFVKSELLTENESLDKSSFQMIKNPGLKFIPEPERRENVASLSKKNDFFFAKNLKSVPRIGRRNDFFAKTAAKSIPRIGRRDISPAWMDTEGVAAWPWLRNDFGMGSLKRSYGNHIYHDDNDYVRFLDLTKELVEPRLQPVVQEY